MVGSFLKIKFEFRDVEKSRSSERRRFGRVDDRDLDFGLALADQLDLERAARRDARSACSTQGNRSENCCVPIALHAGLSVHAGKLLRADVRNARSARSGARAGGGRGGQEDGGVQERDAADFEDVGGVGRGVLRLVQEGRERHAADLEDVVERDDDDEDGTL